MAIRLRAASCLAALLLSRAALAIPASAPASAPASQPVARETIRFTAPDGVTLVGDFYAPRDAAIKNPCAILLHMYPETRTSWRKFAPQLCDAGFAVLAFDLRGTGDSVGPASAGLAERYRQRDPRLFGRGQEDVAAARRWLAARADCDADRVVLVGASVGASIALHHAMRDPRVCAVVCLSPGLEYMGLKSSTHLRLAKCDRFYLFAPSAESEACEELAKIRSGVTVSLRTGGTELHGTRLLESDYGPELAASIVTLARDAVLPRPKLFQPRRRP